jgi:hypothetical protein
MNFRRAWLGLSAAVAGAFVLAAGALSMAAAQGAENGRVRVMHASPDTPPVDIFVNGEKAVTGLAFPNNTGYVSLPAGGYNVKVFVSPSDGTGTPALEADLQVAGGSDYTVLAVGRVGDGSLSLLPLQDNNATPAVGQAHVRLVHASPDAPAVDVGVAGTGLTVFSGVAFKGASAYTPVAAGTYTLEVKPAGGSQVVLSIPNLPLQDRAVYTAVAVGLVGDGSLAVVPLVDVAPAAAAAASPTAGAPAAGTGLAGQSGDTGGMALAVLAVAALVMLGGGTLAIASARRRG